MLKVNRAQKKKLFVAMMIIMMIFMKIFMMIFILIHLQNIILCLIWIKTFFETIYKK